MWREDLYPKIQVARKLAAEFGAAYIPLDGLFSFLSIASTPKKWAQDGVRPTPSGHYFIAQQYVDVLNQI